MTDIRLRFGRSRNVAIRCARTFNTIVSAVARKRPVTAEDAEASFVRRQEIRARQKTEADSSSWLYFL